MNVRSALLVVCASALTAMTLIVPPGHAVAASPVHVVTVAGDGVGSYPGFASEIERYAITTTDATGGTVTVSADTDDPAGKIFINGRLETDGSATITGLTPNDEVSVIFDDGGGVEKHALIYLPPDFPSFTTPTLEPGKIQPGYVGLTLSQWMYPTPNFDAVVDVHGVPVWAERVPAGSLDLKRLGNGHYSVFRTTTTPDRTGMAEIELDAQFHEVSRHETVGLVNTDGHDVLLLANGHRVLAAYERDPATQQIDTVLQEIDQSGTVVFQWDSKALKDETVLAPDGTTGRTDDYAHFNSVFVMQDGDWLLSFRHLSAVLKIARTAHDGFQPGDIVWRLGGRHSDFTFVDDAYAGGPCAQHNAVELPNGDIQIFDNGSADFAGSMCIDPADPLGAAIARPQTRLTVYHLDPTAHTATLVREYRPGRFSLFAGSAEPLANGNTLLNWVTAPPNAVSEIDADNTVVWELAAVPDAQGHVYSSYRAWKFDVPDVTAPTLTVPVPAEGASFDQAAAVPVDLACTDRGGSSLHSCGGDLRSGDPLDTSAPGPHTVTFVATDGDGNQTTVTRHYTVLPQHRPDTAIRAPGSSFVGEGVYGTLTGQRITQSVSSSARRTKAFVRVSNAGIRSDRLRVVGTSGTSRLAISYWVAGEDVTARVVAGTYRTTRLAPGAALTITVKLVRGVTAVPGSTRRVRVTAGSVAEPSLVDTVQSTVTVTS